MTYWEEAGLAGALFNGLGGYTDKARSIAGEGKCFLGPAKESPVPPGPISFSAELREGLAPGTIHDHAFRVSGLSGSF